MKYFLYFVLYIIATAFIVFVGYDFVVDTVTWFFTTVYDWLHQISGMERDKFNTYFEHWFVLFVGIPITFYFLSCLMFLPSRNS